MSDPTMVRDLELAVRQREEEFLAELATWVAQDSGSTDKPSVDAMATICRARLEAAGFAVERLPVADYGDCLHARLAGRGTARILLVGHLDTVFATGTAAERPMRVARGRILGPGTSDMKAGVLAGIYAVESLRQAGFDDFAEIGFFCNSEEEVGSPVSRKLYAGPASASDAVLVLEAGRADGSIVSARKGGAHYYVTIRGKAAHSGVEPEKGANAVHELARQVVELAALTDLRPGTTVNVCRIRGGARVNVIPDLAEAEIDARVVQQQDMAPVEEAIRRIVEHPRTAGTTGSLGGGFGAYPMAKTAAVALLVEMARTVAANLGFALHDVATGGVSDANKVAALGVPVLDGLGPVGGLDHGPDEYVDLASVAPRTALLAGLIVAIAGRRAELADIADR